MRYHTGCLYKKSPTGRSGTVWGAKGINLLMSTLQNRLVDHG
ncbi:hemolysin activator protein [Escherichia coli]|uniref:Hemolysin activator protein n=1 Tax=Escherichia coli TaxID=562 RepID=A0A376D292_ECOLX|nr:hemolysin activator protein [Escherichia coli]